MGDQQWIARIGDDGGELVRHSQSALGLPSNITPESEVMRPPSNAAVIFCGQRLETRTGEGYLRSWRM